MMINKIIFILIEWPRYKQSKFIQYPVFTLWSRLTIHMVTKQKGESNRSRHLFICLENIYSTYISFFSHNTTKLN